MSMKIGDFELVDHGLEHSSYFQGCGTSFTPFEYCTTGIGDNPKEALDDLMEMVAQMGFDAEDIYQRILDDENDSDEFPETPSAYDEDSEEGSELYYHLSLRWNKSNE